ncbi:hypothetical protein FRB96_000617 [Tulasnella sp. 330]|nr:hypothetical protein FRB96_000617 [Tulasnella sp. 330]KAG8881014.1 hypothetical protein FRB97_000259 [Tulasnella sp. 331]KAG8887419.1 hypothetical protein FRB98_009619 [Tulasnella sp. 332]
MAPDREISNQKHKKQIPRRLRYQEPPSTDHLPWAQAQKVKREWVEEKMIKRAYFHEKKRMGLVPAKTGANAGAEDSGWGNKRRKVDESEDAGSSALENAGTETQPVGGWALGTDRLPVKDALSNTMRSRPRKDYRQVEVSDSNPTAGPSTSTMEPQSEPPTIAAPSNLPHDNYLPTQQDSAKHPSPSETSNPSKRSGQPPSLRDLTRKAYARSSLHTYKSETPSLRKDHTGRIVQTSRVKTTNAKGQPNMKLRMEAMLERIQRTL